VKGTTHLNFDPLELLERLALILATDRTKGCKTHPRFKPDGASNLRQSISDAGSPLEGIRSRHRAGLAVLTHIGRLPARTAEHAQAMVTKILAYEQAPPPAVLLTADGADANYDFPALSEQLRAELPASWPQSTAYVDALGPAGARAETIARLAEGPSLVTYVGHGATTMWGQQAELQTTDDVEAGSGSPAGLVIALTCLTGFFTTVYPPEAGLGEALLRSPTGAVAVWGSSSLTGAAGQIAAGRRLVADLAAARFPTLGEALHAARQATLDPDIRASWILFGDPALSVRSAP
jgi:hypothetical protein